MGKNNIYTCFQFGELCFSFIAWDLGFFILFFNNAGNKRKWIKLFLLLPFMYCPEA